MCGRKKLPFAEYSVVKELSHSEFFPNPDSPALADTTGQSLRLLCDARASQCRKIFKDRRTSVASWGFWAPAGQHRPAADAN
jgi:hypothetical protein